MKPQVKNHALSFEALQAMIDLERGEGSVPQLVKILSDPAWQGSRRVGVSWWVSVRADAVPAPFAI
jgi:hypothetical protein